MTSGLSRSRSQYQSSTRRSPCVVSVMGGLGAFGGPCVVISLPRPPRALSTTLKATDRRSMDRGRLWGRIFVGVAFAAAVSSAFLGEGVSRALVTAAGGLAALAALVWGVRRYRLDRSLQWHVGRPITWKLLGAGLALLIFGGFVRSLWGSGLHVPAAGDLFVVAAYPLLAAGLLLMVRGRAPGQSLNSLLLGAIVAIAVAFSAWMLLFGGLVHSGKLSVLAASIALAVPAF